MFSSHFSSSRFLLLSSCFFLLSLSPPPLPLRSGCDPGSFKVASSNTCQQCSPGKFAEVLGLFECKRCPIGFYGDTPGATLASACKRCDEGRYSDISGLSSRVDCKECEPGSFSPPNDTGAGLGKCKNCPRGYHAIESSSSSCDPCTPGRYNAYDEKFAGNHVTCDDCPDGLPVSDPGAFYCTGCSAGKFEADTTTSSITGVCGDCPIGWQGLERQGLEKPPRCEQCGRGMYQAEAGKPYCLPW